MPRCLLFRVPDSPVLPATFGLAARSLITALGSAGMLVAMFCLVFMGLPSAGAVSPLEALPGFFTGLAAAVTGLIAILLVFAVLAPLVGILWNRLTGRRGIVHGAGRHAAA